VQEVLDGVLLMAGTTGEVPGEQPVGALAMG
jgi:hypothetical protein